jgi:uncharacterized protein (DUF983 family)
MPNVADSSTLSCIARQLCPRCRRGAIFHESAIYRRMKMYEYCAVCSLKFEREPGYFLGAMYISYGLGVVSITLIALLLWAATSWGIVKIILWASALFLPLVWPITLFSRVLWLYLDWALDPVRE